MGKLYWKYTDSTNKSKLIVATLYTGNDKKVLSLYDSKGTYTTYSTDLFKIPYWKITYKEAVELARKNKNFSKLPEKEKERLRLEAACKIVEEKVKECIVDSFLSKFD